MSRTIKLHEDFWISEELHDKQLTLPKKLLRCFVQFCTIRLWPSRMRIHSPGCTSRWAPHLHRTVLPVQGYIQLRPHDTTLPSFWGCPTATAGPENEPTHTEAATKGCATDHDDHICYNCERRLLFPERIQKWETPSLPICDLWCQECATQRCCTRGTHEYHLCMQCERRGVVFLAPAGGEDPWAANDD